jgi:uncharacterized protein (UPF0261 family)
VSVATAILVVGTVDTKSDEIAFLREHIEQAGRQPVVMDVGVLGRGAVVPHISNTEVAAAAGLTLHRCSPAATRTARWR